MTGHTPERPAVRQHTSEQSLGGKPGGEVKYDESEREAALAAMDSLSVTVRTEFGIETYDEAADPGYKSSFTRDSMVANSLRGDPDVLVSRIAYSVNRIGRKTDPLTGEEPGKPHHELPNVIMGGMSTAYNACDTAAELLRAIAALSERGHDKPLNDNRPAVDACVGYIKRHVAPNGLFIEDPAFAGNDEPDGRRRRFGLKVTYWKDSELNRPGSKQPAYPIVYTLAHFQNARALERIGGVIGDERLARFGRYMVESGVKHLWRGDHFVTAVDTEGDVDPPSSDSLHSLLYITKNNLPAGYARKIGAYMERLATDYGYRSSIPAVPDVDPYHTYVWTHEQALLHAAASSHGLDAAADVASRIQPMILPKEGYFPETIDPETGMIGENGNARQLWAMGAFLYFQDPGRALL